MQEDGVFMEKNKDICKPPFYCAVDFKTMQAVQKQLDIALPLLHNKMLESSTNAESDSLTPVKKRRVRLVVQEKSG